MLQWRQSVNLIIYMGYDKKSGGFGGGSNGVFRKSGKPDFKHGDGARKPLFEAICATCNKKCQVPFRPNGEKPVYCSDCFRAGQDSKPQGNFNRPTFSQPQQSFTPVAQVPDRRIDDLKKQIEVMNSKLDTIVRLIGGGSALAPAPVVTIKPVVERVAITPVSTIEAPIEKTEKKDKKISKKKYK